jgi:pro-apoptotic serine protease NMA111
MYRLAWIFIALIASASAWSNQDADWSEVINRATDSIVTIRVDAVRAFDTGGNKSSQATGFVVDAKRGIVLTNRHVVQSGPVVAEALFSNREEIALKAIYRDPVHDFGFFQYDPAELKFITPKGLSIKPEEAVVGREIRVVGNDAGEQLSILAGTLARTDRQAPFYGRGRYNDFNTFYYQSASGVSGGSSGSPVLDSNGNVIALNAGGSVKAASSFFLPLQRVKRALQLIQQGKDVSRGTLQTTFDYKPYDEVRRLGLRAEVEAELRKINHGIGLLVVRRSLPGSIAHKVLQSGDIVVKGGESSEKLKWLKRFDELESLLDNNVNQEITLLIERNGSPLEVKVKVDDLHKITPEKYLTFGQSILHNLSYQQARHLNRPVEGVYVAQPGYMLSSAGVPRAAIIQSINNKPTKNIHDVEKVVSTLLDRQEVSLRYITFNEPHRMQVSVMRMDRRWFPLRKCYRDDSLGRWPCEVLRENSGKRTIDQASVKFIEYADQRANRLSSSIVSVKFDIPYHVDGISEAHYAGAGLIVDKKDGLILVDRNTVPTSLGDVSVTFAGALDIPAKVVFIHPLHNLAFIQYDPALLGSAEIEEIELHEKELKIGDDVWLVALKDAQQLLVEKTKVSAVDSLKFPVPQIPVFRESNLDAISLHNPPASIGGVLSDEKGRVVAAWLSFSYGSSESKQFEWGVSAEIIKELVDQWRCCKQFKIRSLEVQLSALSISQARKLGLSDAWTERFQDTQSKRQVLSISRRVAGSDAENKLREGDLILAIDGELVRNYRDVEKAAQKESLVLTVSRLGKQQDIQVETQDVSSSSTNNILLWAGALIQAPHRELALQRGIKPQGVYLSYVFHGSPANRSGLNAMLRIVEINGEKVETIDRFKRLIEKYKKNNFLQIKVLDLLNRESSISVKQNQYYWPDREIYRVNDEWQSSDGFIEPTIQ